MRKFFGFVSYIALGLFIAYQLTTRMNDAAQVLNDVNDQIASPSLIW